MCVCVCACVRVGVCVCVCMCEFSIGVLHYSISDVCVCVSLTYLNQESFCSLFIYVEGWPCSVTSN